jgi:outer membrane protein OmpA-like peptidoglycan-associated protein
LPGIARAQTAFAQRLSLRYSMGASLMVSRDQRDWLRYASPGVLSDLQIALRISPLIAAQVGLAGGIFFSKFTNGAVLAPMLGGTVHWPLLGVPTYLVLNVGAAFTGSDMRPFGRAVLGIDWALSPQFTAGPMLGMDVVQQQDGELYSTNAIYAWVGVGLAYRPVGRPALPVRKAKPVARDRGVVLPPPAAEMIPDEPPLPFEPSVAREPAAPSTEIRQLLEEAVHVSHTELLAPVLFEYDSVELEPSSVAMLHEVARTLTVERKDIQLLAVIAYSDARGPAEYNLELSERRARHVRDWLVAHGVEAQRLTVEARGATDPVEEGEAADHQQNRRVVFRVLRAEPQP